MKGFLCAIGRELRSWYVKLRISGLIAYCIVTLSVQMLFTRYTIPLQRLLCAVADLGRSVAYWFLFVFEKPIEAIFGDVPQIEITLFDSIQIDLRSLLPFDLEEIQYKLTHMWGLVIDLENLGDYHTFIMDKLYLYSMLLSLLLPIGAQARMQFLKKNHRLCDLPCLTVIGSYQGLTNDQEETRP